MILKRTDREPGFDVQNDANGAINEQNNERNNERNNEQNNEQNNERNNEQNEWNIKQVGLKTPEK